MPRLDSKRWTGMMTTAIATAAWSATTHAAPLPDRVWGTYLGGAAVDRISAVAVDGAGDIYVCGDSLSQGLGTPGVHQEFKSGGPDVILARFTPAGERVWTTCFGGTLADRCADVKVDGAGDIVIVGNTQSSAGITTPDSLQPFMPADPLFDGYVAKFDASGQRLWGTYIAGGSSSDYVSISSARPTVRWTSRCLARSTPCRAPTTPCGTPELTPAARCRAECL